MAETGYYTRMLNAEARVLELDEVVDQLDARIAELEGWWQQATERGAKAEQRLAEAQEELDENGGVIQALRRHRDEAETRLEMLIEYAARVDQEIPILVRRGVERGRNTTNVDIQRIVGGVLAHSASLPSLREALKDAVRHV